MTYEEAQKAIEQFKKEGFSDEEILIVFHDMFRDDKISLKELGEMLGLLGYELTEEFLNLSEEEQKEALYEVLEEEGEEKAEETKSGEDEKAETKESPEQEKEQEEKARKLFGLN